MSFWSESMKKCSINWYDYETNTWQTILDMTEQPAHLALISNQFVFAVGSYNLISQSVKMFDLSLQTPSWLSLVNMLVGRRHFGVGVLNNCVYAVSSINILANLYYK